MYNHKINIIIGGSTTYKYLYGLQPCAHGYYSSDTIIITVSGHATAWSACMVVLILYHN